MCVTHRAADATEPFVLRAFDMPLSEISTRDASRLGQDRITRTPDLTGTLGPAPAGVGFHKGVRFDLQAIIPN